MSNYQGASKLQSDPCPLGLLLHQPWRQLKQLVDPNGSTVINSGTVAGVDVISMNSSSEYTYIII